jgi:ATPase family associated with various cellular activities (AAA)
MDYFENSLQHLLAELERIDLLIAAQVAHTRRLHTDDEQFRGLYISEDEVDALLKRPIGRPRWTMERTALSGLAADLDNLSQQINLRKEDSLRQGVELRLPHLRQLFGLNQFEADALLVCLAVEVDLRYERLYAYLHDDVTQKRPSVDVVLSLLTPSVETRIEASKYFTANAPLFRHRLLEMVEDPSRPQPPLLAKYLKVDGRIAQYLLGSDELDDRIAPYAAVREPHACLDTLLVLDDITRRVVEFVRSDLPTSGVIVYLRGPYGVGRQSTAAAVCKEEDVRLLVVDLERLGSDGDSSAARALGFLQREAKLQRAAVYWRGFDTLLQEEKKGLFRTFQSALKDRPALTFLDGERLWEPADALRGAPFVCVDLQKPTFSERSRIWAAALNGRSPVDLRMDISALSSKFKFTGGQIKDAAATAENLARFRDGKSAAITLADLYEACRLHSNQRLAVLAQKTTPKYAWNDIVLPVDRLNQLREIRNHVKYRERVYEQWGFDRKLSLGKGLSILFAGPSGTGKTMAADIIAGELALDLYRIDLSTVVSKYIGETEKNLSQIFSEAETSNSILFFDEADALFGKRSEVKDAHDRYANVETAYLLQRMEQYEGVVILATNFRKNMDEAFVRRLHFTVEFPFPNEEDRYRIWEDVWPKDTPRDPGLNLAFMARRFQITGGNIRNIALAAAFLAADDSGVVGMHHLIRATQREYQKMGKVVAESEFELNPPDVVSVG